MPGSWCVWWLHELQSAARSVKGDGVEATAQL
eukprot:SAG11_NODE_24687_length_369_cov_1.733333_1_plen_31_part_10